MRNTPGVTFLLGENGNTATGDSIFMRGFDTQGSIFIDGIRDLGSVTRDTFNTEQVKSAKDRQVRTTDAALLRVT